MSQAGSLTPAERRDYKMGRRSFERGDDEASLLHLIRLIRTRGYADVHYMIGVMHERAGDLGAAGQSLREALRINPSYSEALLALANVYENQGDFERSRDIAERAGALARPADGVLDATTRGKLAIFEPDSALFCVTRVCPIVQSPSFAAYCAIIPNSTRRPFSSV
jgi:tetratricopeptide (TPR) repeat protein